MSYLMTDNHPITPPLKLVQQWIEKYGNSEDPHWQTYECDIATQAARWGADQELEACINYFLEYDSSWGENSELVTGLRAARRPKPPSLKEQALETLKYPKDLWSESEVDTIRLALEALPE
jgi:hypothetical protein